MPENTKPDAGESDRDGFDSQGRARERFGTAERWAGTHRNYRPRRIRADRTLKFAEERANEIKRIMREIDDIADDFRWATPAERMAVRQLRRDMWAAGDIVASLLRFGDAIDDAVEQSRFADASSRYRD